MSDDDASDSSDLPDVNAPLSKVCIKDIKGRWLHSNANIGLITVVPAESHAVLTDGTIWDLQEKGNTIRMDEYAIVPKKSTLSELVWMNTVDKCARRYRWFFEDDGDIELDFAPAELGKRQLIPCDSDSDEDAGSDSDDVIVESDDEACAPKDSDGALAVPKVVELFTEWILSTNTIAHEKRLARQGHLSREFPVRVRGGGIRSLETKLAALGVTHDHINHRKTGTFIILKEAARKKFIEKHPEHRDHFAHPKEGEDDTTPKRRRVECVAASASAEPSSLDLVESLQEQLANAHTPEIFDILLDKLNKVTISPDLLRKTKIGVDVNGITKNKALPDHVRAKASEILQEWKTVFRAQR